MRHSSTDETLKARGLKKLYREESGNAKRIVLLVILLLVLAAAAVFLLYPDLFSPAPEPAKPAKAQVKRKVVQLPKKAEQKAAPKKVAEKVAKQKAPAKGDVASKADAEKAKLQAEAQKQATAKAAAKAETQKAEVKKTEVQKAEAKKAPQKVVTTQPEQKPAAKAATSPKGPYVVSAGAYLLSASVKNADQKVQELGYTPYHSKVTREIEVIRLKEGTYPEAEARARLAQYKREFSSEAFVLKASNGWTVYLGSYVGLDRARVYADRLYAQGLRVSEEKAMVPMELTLVRFGDFPDQASAEAVVAKAKAAGLGAYASKVK